MSSVPSLTLDRLSAACRSAAALRWTSRLQPAGGQGDKVFPPTYEGGEYAMEERFIDGRPVPCVLLDSVQSQANRMESALLDAHRDARIQVPLVVADFDEVGLPEVGPVTSLDAPHRLADAILRDCLLGGMPFRRTQPGQVLDTASNRMATGLFELCPTALLFGLWDSTGPRGGLGTKFARALVGELVAIDARVGVRPSSRIDPVGIVLGSGPVYAMDGQDWTLDPAKADKNKDGKPAERKPSEINHGNVTPSLKNNDTKKPHHGGVTFAYARHSAVISLPALRRLRFPPGDEARDVAGRTALAALGLASIALLLERGIDLRSRCLLVPDKEQPPSFEIIEAEGTSVRFSLSANEACSLLRGAVDLAKGAGLVWGSTIHLTPRPELATLVRKSRELAMKSTESK